ncbi:uncharacterized protein LOC112557357 isoform X2 [Pomacea canaliculata]|uniref:uncharacterized protein LOC112557357 isoform X2 n=1 Tax=Pomacea canaliculata TaxID=400727 RepID=UPI000D738D53|nr:uncharacterized protein LOC112557357 isoform X2 [Pomacea canaliculata]
MSDHPMAVPDCVSSASSSQHPKCEGAGQGQRGTRAGRRSEGSEVRKSGRKQRQSKVVCHHAVPQAHAGVLTEEVVEEIRAESGARIMLDASASPMAGGTLVTITGVADQMEAAVRCIRQRTGSQGAISEHAQMFWREWVEDAWPDLDSGPHFLPPVYFNRVPTSSSQVAGQNIRVFCQPFGQAGRAGHPGSSHPEFVRGPTHQPTLVSDCQTRDDSATQRVFFCLKTLYTTNNEVLVGLTNLQFEQYLSDPWYTLAAAELPVPSRASEILPNVRSRGDFDVLLIHRHYGLVVCEVKALGDNVQELEMCQQEFERHLKERLLRAVSQLDKAEAMLSYLVSDIALGLRVSKTIALPNISACQMSKVISSDTELTQELSRCLKASDPTDIVDLCLCADRLSDPSAPWDVRSETLTELGKWWQRCVTHEGEDSHMTSDVYKTLVARFCGPPTTVTVPSIFPARLCVKTLHQAVSWTGECHACLTLFPEQAHLLNAAPPRVFLTGPPGTGKTVVLQLMATQWLQCGNDVYVVSTWRRSRAACIMLHHLLQQTLEAQPSTIRGQVHLLLYDLDTEENVRRAVDDLSERSTSLYVIADEAGPDERSARFQTFCEKLQTRVSGLHLWAASCRHGIAPEGLEVKAFTRPLRSPPVVAREVGKAERFTSPGKCRVTSSVKYPTCQMVLRLITFTTTRITPLSG